MARPNTVSPPDPEARGGPTGFKPIPCAKSSSAGAGFVVAICGEIMTHAGPANGAFAEKYSSQMTIGDVQVVLSRMNKGAEDRFLRAVICCGRG